MDAFDGVSLKRFVMQSVVDNVVAFRCVFIIMGHNNDPVLYLSIVRRYSDNSLSADDIYIYIEISKDEGNADFCVCH